MLDSLIKPFLLEIAHDLNSFRLISPNEQISFANILYQRITAVVGGRGNNTIFLQNTFLGLVGSSIYHPLLLFVKEPWKPSPNRYLSATPRVSSA